MAAVKLYLDWTPNTNHTGFYVARERGYYRDRGIELEIESPHVDDYKVTPAKKLQRSENAFAVAPSETVVSAHTRSSEESKQTGLPQAVAAVLQQDLSAIVTLASSGISRPAQLDNKTYASYGARFEGRIVQQLITQDGGSGKFVEITPPMLGIWETILKEKADATWVFLGWEGVDAERKGIKLNAFRLADAGIPYGYTPVLVANSHTLRTNADQVRQFLAATAKGFEWAAHNPQQAAQLLVSQVEKDLKDAPLPEPLDLAMVEQSQQLLSKHYLDRNGKWGTMDPGRCEAFLDWLSDAGLLTDGIPSRTQGPGTVSLDDLRGGNAGSRIPRGQIAASELFTNNYLPA